METTLNNCQTTLSQRSSGLHTISLLMHPTLAKILRMLSITLAPRMARLRRRSSRTTGRCHRWEVPCTSPKRLFTSRIACSFSTVEIFGLRCCLEPTSLLHLWADCEDTFIASGEAVVCDINTSAEDVTYRSCNQSQRAWCRVSNPN